MLLAYYTCEDDTRLGHSVYDIEMCINVLASFRSESLSVYMTVAPNCRICHYSCANFHAPNIKYTHPKMAKCGKYYKFNPIISQMRYIILPKKIYSRETRMLCINQMYANRRWSSVVPFLSNTNEYQRRYRASLKWHLRVQDSVLSLRVRTPTFKSEKRNQIRFVSPFGKYSSYCFAVCVCACIFLVFFIELCNNYITK